MNFRKSIFILPIVFTAMICVLAACETDVDLNAPYKNYSVVFAVLDADPNRDGIGNALDTQWVDIDKTFLGDGNNLQYAAIMDSVEYNDEDFVKKVVQRWSTSSEQLLEEYELLSAYRPREDGGLFAALNKVYYFTPSNAGLSANDEYRIYLQFKDGREVTASTNLVKVGGNNLWQTPNEDNMLTLASINSATGGVQYSDTQVKFSPPNNALAFDVKLNFTFTEEVYADASQQGAPISRDTITLSYPIGSAVRQDPTSTAFIIIRFGAEGFFTFLKNTLTVDPRIRRIIGKFDVVDQRTECFDFTLTMANGEFSDYMEANTPSSSIAQERPIYTNITQRENGVDYPGIGLFGSRSKILLRDLPLISSNGAAGNLYAFRTDMLIPYNFCDPNGSSDFSCQ